MNREEIRKKWKNKEFVEITNSKPNLSSNERNYVKPISNDMWSNVMNRANQMLSNTTVNIKNTNNLVKVEKPLLNASKIYTITEEQAKNIANIEDSKKRFEEISKISNNRQQYQQNAIKVNQIRETEKNKKKAEKINQDIKEGNYLSSLGHVLSGLPKEAMNAVTKTTLSLANLNPNTKDSKEMMEAGKILTSNYSDTTSRIDNKIIQGASRVSGTIGNMIPSIATNLMGGPAGLVNAINAGTSSYMENLNEEQNNKLKSTLTGLGKGTLSYYIEKLSGGNFLGKGSLDDLAKQGISKIKSDVGKKIASKVYEVGGEIAEENLENITGYVVDKLINDKDITMEQFVSDLKQTTGDTAITTLVLSALGLGGDTYNQAKINEKIDNSTLSNEQKNVLKKVAEENNASLGEVEALIAKSNQNKVTTMQNNEILQSNQQVMQQDNKTAQNQMSQQTQENVENAQDIEYNNIKIGDVKNISTEKLLSLYNGGGFRSEEQINKLKSSIEKNGFTEPIELVRKNDGTIEIENGNHRLQIAKELGIKEIPVTFVESWENIGLPSDTSEIKLSTDWRNSYDGSNAVTQGNNALNDTNRNIEGRRGSSNNQFENSRTAEKNARISSRTYDSNEQTSDIKTERNTEQIENSKESSFYLPPKQDDRGVIKKATRSRLQLPRTSNSVDTVDNVSTSNNIIPQTEQNMQQPKKISEVFPKQDKRRIVDEVYVDELNEGKIRKHYKSVFESDQVGDVGKDVAKELLKQDTYVPISNLETITSVNENINRNGIGATYNAFRAKMRSNEKIDLQTVATGERLIQIYSQKGDYEKVNELIQDVAILGTELGQQVQALSLIKKASPEGQLQYLTKMLERTNIKENTDIKITNEMAEKILSSKNQEELEQNLSEVAVEIADQLPVTAKDKIRSWRYLSMLGNPKTHIKNIGANVAMNVTQRTKNIVAGTIEDVVSVFNPKMERTKTLKPANKEQRDFAGQDAEYMKDLIDAGGKYDVKNVIQNSKRQFDNRVLNTIAEFNSELLDKEDKIFLKSAYKMALQNYMSANNLKASDMEGKTLEKARQYASLQAQEATFHEFNAVANTLSQLENKGGIVGGATSAILPFKKTPMNIAKAGWDYSPFGLLSTTGNMIEQITKTNTTLKQQLVDGKITEADYKDEMSKMVNKNIDSYAKGLTGTSIAVLGYALAKMGILKAGNNGEDDEFEEQLGEQEYAITIGDNTYTLDWVSPSAIPLFIGATARQIETGEIEPDLNTFGVVTNAMAKAFEPMTEMSMLQGLTSAITSYEQGSSNMIFDLGASMATSYAGQFVPTALGQVARTVDPYERDTSTTKKGIEGKIDRFARQTINKIPGASQKLPTKKDVWGEEVKRPENIVQRGLENAVLPWTRKKLTEDRTAKELLKVFDETGENVLPGTPSKDLTINKEKYRMTTDEYNQAKQDFGQTSKKLLDDLFKSNTYNTLTSEGKAKAIDDIYAYAKEKLKVDYAEKKNEEIKTSTLYNTVTKLQEQKADVSAYFEFKGKIDDLDREKGDEEVKKQEKIEYLQDMKTSSKTKRIIYEETLGTTDKTYKYLSQLTGNKVEINQYLDYKTKGDELKADDDPDSNIKGKTVSGSKKKKIVNYLNNSDFSPVERLYIYGTQYSFDSKQKAKFKSYIDKAKQEGKINSEEATEIYKKLRSVEELEDGKIRWK